MTRDARKHLKRVMAAIWQHFDKAAAFSSSLYPDFKESDPRLGEMLEMVGMTAITGQQMVEAMWEVMWGHVPDLIHPENM